MLRGFIGALVVFILTIDGYSQQCPTTIQQLFPIAHPSLYSGYGNEVTVFGDYMVVAAEADHSVEANSGALFVYKFDGNGGWSNIAKLTPSVAQEGLRLGRLIEFYDNTIISYGQSYSADGSSHFILFVYEKGPASEWTSGTESYQLTGPVTSSVIDMDYDGTDLAVSTVSSAGGSVDLYRKLSGQFAPIQHLVNPIPSVSSDIRFGSSISVESGLLAVSSPGADDLLSSYGKVFVYEYNGGWPSAPTAAMKAAVSPTPFTTSSVGQQVLIHDNTIFTIGTSSSLNALFVFEKPGAAWTDLTVSPLPVVLNTPNGSRFKAWNEYLLFPDESNSVKVFKKSPSWTSLTLVNDIQNKVESDLLFGRSIGVDNNHLVIGAPASFMLTSQTGIGKIVSFYSLSGDWSTTGTPDQILSETPINAALDQFGKSVASNGTYTLIGAPGDSKFGYAAGTAYIFKYDGLNWSNAVKIFPPNLRLGDSFGTSVEIGDSVLFVSALYADSLASNGQYLNLDIGKVYVFRLTSAGWNYHSQLIAPSPHNQGLFGQEIAWSKGLVVISEYNTFTSQSNGIVHIYKELPDHHWQHLAELKPSETINGDFFGRSISMNDSTIVVGTGNIEFSSAYQMKVYVYTKKGNWKNASEDARLLPTTKSLFDYFGYSVALFGDHIVVGSPGYPGFPDMAPTNPKYFNGAAYVFKKPANGWQGTVSQIATLLPSDPSRENSFGISVAIDNRDIFVGAPSSYLFTNASDHYANDLNSYRNGRVYHYAASSPQWQSSSQEFRQLFSTAPEWIDNFGVSIAITNRTLFVGCMFDDTNLGFKSGSAFVFSLDPVIQDLLKPLCIEDGMTRLIGLQKGGTWAGAGFKDSMSGLFDPSSLTAGSYPITYSVLGCTAFNSVEVISAGLKISEKSPYEQIRCSIDQSMPIKIASNADQQLYSWFYKEKQADSFVPLSSGTNTILTKKDGYYLSKIKHPVCFSHLETFNVKTENNDIEIAIPPVICDNTSVSLQASPAGGTWKGGGIDAVNGIYNSVTQKDGTHSVSYTIETAAGCNFSKNVNIIVNKIETSEIAASGNLICAGESLALVLQPIKDDTKVTWYKDSSPQVSSASKTFVAREAGEYYAALTHHSCVSRTQSIKLLLKVDSIFIPNVFTPNGDSYNDSFSIQGGISSDFTVSVFDRDGKEYFQSTNPKFQWTGQGASSGTYYWLVSYRNCSGVPKNHKGWVLLVR